MIFALGYVVDRGHLGSPRGVGRGGRDAEELGPPDLVVRPWAGEQNPPAEKMCRDLRRDVLLCALRCRFRAWHSRAVGFESVNLNENFNNVFKHIQ